MVVDGTIGKVQVGPPVVVVERPGEPPDSLGTKSGPGRNVVETSSGAPTTTYAARHVIGPCTGEHRLDDLSLTFVFEVLDLVLGREILVLGDTHRERLVRAEVHDLRVRAVTETTCPCLRSMIGTHTFASTGWLSERFLLSKTPLPSIRAFALPCLPGLAVLYALILHGDSSIIT